MLGCLDPMLGGAAAAMLRVPFVLCGAESLLCGAAFGFVWGWLPLATKSPWLGETSAFGGGMGSNGRFECVFWGALRVSWRCGLVNAGTTGRSGCAGGGALASKDASEDFLLLPADVLTCVCVPESLRT